jgi:predicted adenylyl cyclase CyaB
MAKAVEVELRILLSNRKKIEKQLSQLGAKIIHTDQLIDYWFCPKRVKNVKGALIDYTGFALRIRELKNLTGGKKFSTLECKTLSDGKDHCFCHEHEITFTDVKSMRNILNDVGLKEFLVVSKKRTVYQYQNIKFCFDKIKGVGDGLEIELMTKGNLAEAKEKLISLAAKLGIKKKQILPKSLTYLAMKKLSKFSVNS